MNNDLDLDIINYNLHELTKLFNISNNLSDEEILKAKNKIEILNNKVEYKEVLGFFKKGYFLLQIVKKYRDYIKLTKHNYTYTEDDDSHIITEIKKTPNYFNYNDPLSVINIVTSRDQEITPNTESKLDELITEMRFKRINNVANVFENPVTRGDVNILKRVTQLMNLNFNSCFRENYYNSNSANFKYQIPSGGVQNVVAIKLSSVEIPNSWYLISCLKGNNKFKIEVTVHGSCSVHEIIIPDGNYDRDTIVKYLNDKYLVNSSNSILKYLEININEFTNKTYFKIVDTAPEDLVFSLHFVDKETENMLETFGWILGFRLARYLKIEDIIESEGLFDAGGDRYVYLSLNDYQYNYNETNVVCFDGTSISENILAKIPLMNGKFSLIINENNNPLIKVRRYNGPVNINKLEIKLLDRFGNIIVLNNMDWSFSIEFETLYENIMS